MGRPQDDRARRMHPMKRPRRRVWRTVVSALAGSGLTAASLSGQLSSIALGAAVPTGPVSGEGPTPPPTNTTTVTGEGTPAQTSTTTTTEVAPPPTERTKTSTTTTTGPHPT